MARISAARIKSEVLKCGRNPNYFINNYIKISHVKRGLISMKAFDFQKTLVDDFADHRFIVVLKARQLGISTITQAYVCWLLNFRREKNVMVVSTKFNTAADFVKKIRKMYNNLDEWLKIGKIAVDNRTSFELDNGSKVFASSTNADAGRGEAVSLLVIDEAAHVPGIDELWTGMYPTLSTGGSCIAISCVTDDTYVYTDKGLRKVKSFVRNGSLGVQELKEYSVLGKDRLRNSSLFFHNGHVATKIIKTPYTELECSLNHKLWAMDEELNAGWKTAAEICENDFIPLQIGMEIWGNDDTLDFIPQSSGKNTFAPKVITRDLSYFLGMFIAEGSSYKKLNKSGKFVGGNITLTCGDDLSPLNETIGFSSSCHDALHYTFSSKQLYEFMEYLGFDLSKRAKEKVIPERLLSMSRENTVAMLQGMFDGDGFSRLDRGTVGYCSASKELVDQVAYLLINLGIIGCRYEAITLPTKKVKAESKGYRLELNSYNSKLFYDIVGFRFARKQEKKESLSKVDKDLSDLLPNVDIWKQLFDKLDFGAWTLQKKHKVNPTFLFRDTKMVHRSKVFKLYDLAKEKLSNAERVKIEKILSPNLRWVPIKSITDSEADTYDFSLPNDDNDFWCHSVVYNGILGHQTPNGVGNWFHRTFMEAETRENSFYPVTLNWDQHPERDQAWFDNETKNMSRRQIAQELLCDFLSSGDTVVEGDVIKRIENFEVAEPLRRVGWDRNYWIWEAPKVEHNYLITADTARGDSKDFSAAVVVNLDTLEQVAEYKGKCKPDLFARLLFDMGREYGDALMAVELNKLGFAVAEKLVELGYPNMYYAEKGTHNFVESYMGEHKDNALAGFTTSSKTRTWVIAKMEEYIRNGMLKIRSLRLLYELKHFVYDSGGRAAAAKGYNDDLVVAFALACWIRDTATVNNTRKQKYNKAFLGGIRKTTVPINTKINGMSGYDNKTLNLKFEKDKLKKAKKQHKEFLWLYKG